MNLNLQRCFLGFAAGAMIATVWSLLLSAMDMAEEQGNIGWLVATGGFIMGVVFLLVLDSIVPHLHSKEKQPEGIASTSSKKAMLILAVTRNRFTKCTKRSRYCIAIKRRGSIES